MAFLKNRWAILAMLVTCWALLASLVAGYYWLRYSDQYNDIFSRIGGVPIYVTAGVDYGNGTRAFYNNTKTLTGTSLLDVTRQVMNVTYQVSPLGTFVTSINDVGTGQSFYWMWWLWNGTEIQWLNKWVSASEYKVANGETFLWYYSGGMDPPP